MKSLLKPLGLSLLVYLLECEAIHNYLKELAKKTDNKYDNVVIESVVHMLLRCAQILKNK